MLNVGLKLTTPDQESRIPPTEPAMSPREMSILKIIFYHHTYNTI